MRTKAYLLKSKDELPGIAGCRTPIGTYGRSLRSVDLLALAGHVFKGTMRRAGISPALLDGIYLGNKYAAGSNPARLAALTAGFPVQIPAMTVERECGSGMEAVIQAMKSIAVDEGSLYLVGGCESMSTVPYVLPGSLRHSSRLLRKLPKFAPLPVLFAVADDGLAPRRSVWDPRTVYMSYTAQVVADMSGVSRKDMDEFALVSQMRAAEAIKSGRFNLEIEPVDVQGRGLFAIDEHPRETSFEKLAALRSSFNHKPKKGLGGVFEKTVEKLLGIQSQPADRRARDITAGNSSGINDGACALLVARQDKARELGLAPLSELVDYAVSALDPQQMGLGPVLAIEKLLAKNKLTVADIDLFEINEAFAAQYLACERRLKLDRSKVNVNGGAIALGHPIGMTGARLVLSLALELKLRGKELGVASLCIGGGQGIAVLVRML